MNMKNLKPWNNFVNERFTTTTGLKLDKLCEIIGYDDFHDFIEDNPGCLEVITNFIEKHFSDKLMEEIEDPEELEELGLYDIAIKVRDLLNEEDEDIDEK